MNELLRFALITLGSVLFIVDPIAVIPTYLVITQDESAAERQRTARRACIAMVLLLTAFAATGTALFSVLGITLAAFRTAGGLILWFVALDMLHGERRTQEGRDEVAEGRAKDDVALTPLAIPMLAGPGAISTVIVVSGQARGAGQTIAVYIAIVLTGLASYVALRIGEPLLRRIGKTGIRVVTRIMGLILAALAVQFVLSGVKEAFQL
jgi:multiple antibiotic resistance protein